MKKSKKSRLNGQPSEDQFAKLVLEEIYKSGDTEEIEYNREEYCLRGKGENWPFAWPEGLFLANPHLTYCSASAEEREVVLRSIVRTWSGYRFELPEDFEDVKPDLLPIVRSRYYFVSQGRPHQVVGEHLALGLAYGHPDYMRTISQSDLDTWGISLMEALKVARRILSSDSGPFHLIQDRGVYCSTTHDDSDCCRLIQTERIRQLPVNGDPIAMIPNYNCLIVTGAGDEAGLRAMVSMAEDGLKQPFPISGIALRLAGDEWTPWLPDPSHPQHEQYRRLRTKSLGHAYAHQQQVLRKQYDENNVSVFVASHKLLEFGGRVRSTGTWTKGAVTSHPQADLVTEPIIADFDEVLSKVGHLMEPQDVYPRRYWVKDFPTEEELRLIRRRLPESLFRVK